MIISKLLGGLGNQMFQYAAGYALSRKLDLPYRIDITLLKKYNNHNGYQLDEIFDSKFEVANNLEIWKVLKLRSLSIINEPVEKVNPYVFNTKEKVFREYSHNFNYNINQICDTCYLSGYWQTTKYFENVKDEIRKIFTFKHELKELNKTHELEILQTNSICLHVRRGDYISNLSALKFHGICSLEYYKKAIQYIYEKVENPFFFIFSDDVEFIKNNFSELKNFKIIDNNQGRKSYIDLRLMALCKHHIIANSTFSWWGAWLAKKENQIVVTPKTWFEGSQEVMNDIYCDNWVKL